MSELLPCPFCGGEAETLTAESMHGGYLFGIMCNDCRSRGDVYDTEAEAIAAWNSRADYHGYEQAAIEAWESIKAWNTRATHGTLTAEQVREVIYKHGVNDGSVYSVFKGSFKAIADELNAVIGGKCMLVETDSYSNAYEVIHVLECSECGETCEHVNGSYKRCPNCGRQVSK